jgi:tRNA-dihydrouridine synthase B
VKVVSGELKTSMLSDNKDNLPSPVIQLAPMAGISDWPFRLLCFEHGCERATTEMISAMGYHYSKKGEQIYRYLLEKHPKEGPVTVQIFGSDPNIMAITAQDLCSLGKFSGIDINMGCPAQKVVSSGSGSALMREPLLAGKIMASVVKVSTIPVSVKFRIGWDKESINILEMARIAEDCGISSITVHGRTRSQQYSGKSDRGVIAQVVNSIKLPVLANGDILSAADALEVLRLTGCSGISIGRGALGNPWIFEQIRAALIGDKISSPSFAHILETAIAHAERMAFWKGEETAVFEMRKHFTWYIRGKHNASQVRNHINTLKKMEDIKAVLSAYSNEIGISNAAIDNLI